MPYRQTGTVGLEKVPCSLALGFVVVVVVIDVVIIVVI